VRSSNTLFQRQRGSSTVIPKADVNLSGQRSSRVNLGHPHIPYTFSLQYSQLESYAHFTKRVSSFCTSDCNQPAELTLKRITQYLHPSPQPERLGRQWDKQSTPKTAG
jgi:hypothetical protein